MARTILLVLAISLLVEIQALGQSTDLIERHWNVDGVQRQALVHIPSRSSTGSTSKIPLLFAFHGHGGTMQYAANNFRYHLIWSEAIVVYMQGLPTKGALTDPRGVRTGWQKYAGDEGDRDIRFFDAVLTTLKRENAVDGNRIYVTGHSNGGSFTYLLWAERGDVFAAVAPAAAVAARSMPKLKPKPAMHIAGTQDELVRFQAQMRTMQAVMRLDGCTGKGEPWAASGNLVGTLYPGANGMSFVSVIYPGTHKFPSEAPELVVKFFKSQHLDSTPVSALRN